jgi:cobalamin-dependent methionine synthase I
VVAPLVKQVGEAWLRGELRMAHERLATSVVRDFIAIGRHHPSGSESHEIIVATPAGQVHEMGALLAAAAARGMGWRTTYLGPSVPAEEIVVCAQIREAGAVALGLAHPADDPHVLGELRQIRRLLPQRTAMIIGGRAAASYHKALDAPDVKLVCDVADFASILENLQR